MKTIGVVRAGLVAGAVALAGVLVPVSSAAADDPPAPPTADMMPINAVPVERAGEVVAWDDPGRVIGAGYYGTSWEEIPPELDGVAVVQVVRAGVAVLALTATGKVVSWSFDMNRLEKIPQAVKDATVVKIVGGNAYAGAVTDDGRVLIWGPKAPPGEKAPLDIPDDLPSVKQLVLAERVAVALTVDGQVVAWGQSGTFGDAKLRVPEELNTPEQAPVALAASGSGDVVYALTKQGTVVAWGGTADTTGTPAPVLTPPAATQIPGNVKAIAGWEVGGAAVLADDTLIVWRQASSGGQSGQATLLTVPESVVGKTPALLTGDSSFVGMVDSDHVIHQWPGISTVEKGLVPEGLDGRPIVSLALGSEADGLAIVTKMLRAAPPTITGTAKVGNVLTGTAGTFSASPTSVTSRWLVNGVEAGDGPTLTVTAGMVGKKIVYESTATKEGETEISSESAPVSVPVAPIVKTTPGVTVKVVKAPSGKKAGTATITVRGGAVATGKVTVTVSGKVKKGKKTKKQTIRLTGVLKNGVATVTVKKIKNAKGKWAITAAYAGDAKHNPAVSKPVKFKVKKK